MARKKVISKLIEDLRGSQSQVDLSKRLGFDYNVVARWERLEREVYWDEFVSLCGLFKIDLGMQLSELLGVGKSRFTEGGVLIKELVNIAPQDSIIGPMLTRNKYWRLVKGRTRLTFSVFLNILESVFKREKEFILGLTGVRKGDLESLRLKEAAVGSDLSNLLICLLHSLKGKGLSLLAQQLGESRGDPLQKSDVFKRVGLLFEFQQNSHIYSADLDRARILTQKLLSDSELPLRPGISGVDQSEFLSFPSNSELDGKINQLVKKFRVELMYTISKEAGARDRIGFASLNFMQYL